MKKPILALPLLWFLSLAAGAQTGSALFQEGRDAFSDKLFSRSVGSFQKFIEEYPSDPRVDQADYMIGVSFFYLKRFGEAADHFKAYRSRYPGSAYLKRISYWKGLSYYALERFPEAIAAFSEQTAFREELYFLQKSYQFLGYCYEKTEEFPRAVQAYQDLIDLGPEKRIAAQAIERQGVIFLNQGEYQRALDLFTRITVEYRDVPQLLRDIPFYMGECRYHLGDEAGSIRKFEAFLSLYAESENREKAIFRLGTLYARKGDTEAAKEYMNLLTQEYPGSPYAMDAHIVLADSYLQSGDWETARASLNALLASETDPAELQKLQFNLARSWADDPVQALKWYLLASKGPGRELAAESLFESGRLYDQRGEPQRGILFFERLFNQFKESPFREEVGEWMAVYYEGNRRDAPLKSLLDTMLAEYPAHPKTNLFLYMRANVAYRGEDYPGALGYYQNLLSKDEANATLQNEARYRIGYIYTLRKEFNRAKGYFQEILEEGERGELRLRALLSVGICSLNIEETDQAAAAFTRVTEEDGEGRWSGEAWFYLGQIATEEGNYYRSSDYFASAAALARSDERRIEALYQLGWSSFRLERFEEAADSFHTLAAEFPDHELAGDSLYRAGVSLAALERWEASLELFLPALEQISAPSIREELLYRIALSHLMQEQFSPALDALDALAEEFPRSSLPPEGLYRGAEALQELEKSSSALYAYRQFFRRYPGHPLAETALSRAYALAEPFSESLALMKEYLSRYPEGDQAFPMARRIRKEATSRTLLLKEEDLLEEILALPLTPALRGAVELPRLYPQLKEKGALVRLAALENREGLRQEEKDTILLYKGIYSYYQGEDEAARSFLEEVLEKASPTEAAEAQFYLALLLTHEGAWTEAADAFLRIRYRYPEEGEWIARGLYEASRAYGESDDEASFVRTAELLLTEFPDSRWTRLLGKAMKELPPEEADPHSLSPSEELPLLE